MPKKPGMAAHVNKFTRQRPLKLGRMSETFNEVLNHILDELESAPHSQFSFRESN